MTNKQKIEALEKGIKSSVTPEPLKEKMRTQLAQLKALEKESTSDKKPKFKVGDVVVLKGETTLEKEITSYKQNSKGEFVYKAKYVSKPEATGEWNEEEIEIFVSEKKETPSNEDVLAILYNADSKGWNATKAESGGDIKASDELTEKYANAVSKALKGIKKGSLSEEIFDELTDGNNHLLNEFLVWNGYYDAKTTATNKASYKRIWDKGNRQVANPEIISLGAKKMKPSSATPIKKATRNYYRNKEIKSVTILENGKKVTYAGKDVLNGANFFKEGGALVSKAKYVPIRNIVEVTFEDGSKDKPRNGYHIKNGATPIMEHGGVVNYEKGKTYPVKKVSVAEGEKIGLDGFPNFHKSGSISGMKKQYYGKDALLIQSGNYIYNVTSEPEIYFRYEHGGVLDYNGKTAKQVWDNWSKNQREHFLADHYDVIEPTDLGAKDSEFEDLDFLTQSQIELHISQGQYEHGGPIELPEGSFIHYQNYYLENGGNIDKNPVELKGYRVNFYKSHDKTGSNIVSDGQFKDMILVTDGKSGDSFSVMSNEPHLMLVERTIFGKKYLHVTPVNVKAPNSGRMFGGNFVWSSDSRFRENVSDLPLPLHDRVEVYEKGGELKKRLSNEERKELKEILNQNSETKNNAWVIDESKYDKESNKFTVEIDDEAFVKEFDTESEAYAFIFNYYGIEAPKEYKLGGALLSAWKRERKYVNKSQDYETRYAKGKNRKGYKKLAKGGEVGDYAKVPVGYNMTHYGLIKKVITNDVLYPENGYEIAGIGDVLHPEQFEIISSAEFSKLKKQGTEVKPNHFLIIEEKYEVGGPVDNKFNYMMLSRLQMDCDYYLGFGNRNEKVLWAGNVDDHIDEMKRIWNNLPKKEKPEWLSMEDILEYEKKMKSDKFEKGGVLSKGDEVYIFELRKNAKVISIKELNDFEDEIVVELADGTKKDLRSSEVMKAEKPKVNPKYDPNSGLTLEEWKAKHNIQNYGKGGKTEKGQGKGAIFAIAKEIRKPGEKWQDAVARAGKLNK